MIRGLDTEGMAAGGATVALPCDRSEEWSETEKFILLLSQARSAEDLGALISSAGTHKDKEQSGRVCMLRGFQRYVKAHCSPKEQTAFFKVILPGICRLASQLPALCPAEGIPFVRAQEGARLRPSVPCWCARSGH